MLWKDQVYILKIYIIIYYFTPVYVNLSFTFDKGSYTHSHIILIMRFIFSLLISGLTIKTYKLAIFLSGMVLKSSISQSSSPMITARLMGIPSNRKRELHTYKHYFHYKWHTKNRKYLLFVPHRSTIWKILVCSHTQNLVRCKMVFFLKSSIIYFVPDAYCAY